MSDSAYAAEADISDGERAALELLDRGTLQVEGRLVDASNATLFCTITGGGVEATCVYKPIAGERPLWDFPTGTLAGREVASYVVSRAAGWNIVPPTVMRDGPFGPGMCQLWIDIDDEVDLVALARRADHQGLREMAVLDAVINNADRKIGHLLPVTDGHLYGCDHGVTFSEDYKLRTVLWQWRGKPLPRQCVEVLRRLAAGLRSSQGADGSAQGWLADELGKYLTTSEVDATRVRVESLLKDRVHPYPPEDWPAVPWPPVLSGGTHQPPRPPTRWGARRSMRLRRGGPFVPRDPQARLKRAGCSLAGARCATRCLRCSRCYSVSAESLPPRRRR